DPAFDLLHNLMNMAVQDRSGSEALDVGQGLLAVVGSPSPIGIDGPAWNVGKEHNRSAGRATLEISLKPFELLVTQRSHASSFQIGNIYETDEMHTFVIEAGPSSAFCAFSVA